MDERERLKNAVWAALALLASGSNAGTVSLWGNSFADGKVCAGFKIDTGGTDNRGAAWAARAALMVLAHE